MGINLVKNPVNFTNKDYKNYRSLVIKTNVLHHYYDPKNPYPRSSDSYKWREILKPIWYGKEEEEYEEKGVCLFRATLTRC